MKPVLLNPVTLVWQSFVTLTWQSSVKLSWLSVVTISAQNHDVTQHQLNGEKDSMVLIFRVDQLLLSLPRARPVLAPLLEVVLQALHEDLTQATAEDCASFSWQSSS